jgi:hypothetical protein
MINVVRSTTPDIHASNLTLYNAKNSADAAQKNLIYDQSDRRNVPQFLTTNCKGYIFEPNPL